MGPHYVFGLSWGEMSAIVGIIVLLITLFVWLAHEIVTKPMETANKGLQKSIDLLTLQVEKIGGNADLVHKEHDRRLDKHDIKLTKHDEELNTLFHEIRRKH